MILKNCKAEDFLFNIGQKKVICFGAGTFLIEDTEVINGLEERIAFFVDNDKSKWNAKFEMERRSYNIVSPEVLKTICCDEYVLLITCMSYTEVYQQLEQIEEIKELECYMYNCIKSTLDIDLQNFFSNEIKKPAYAEYKSILERMELKDKYKGKRCFIIGNGPSLQPSDLDRIKDEISFGCNRINLVFDKTEWRPTYYFCIDYYALQYGWEEILNMNVKHKFVPIQRAISMGKVSDEFTYYSRNTQYATVLGEGIVGKKNEVNFSRDVVEGVYGAYTVLYDTVQFAIYMGFKEIYLLGVDNDFSVELKSDGSTLRKDMNDHFSKDYNSIYAEHVSKGSDVDGIARAFLGARRVAESLGVKLFNATRGGKLEVLEKVNFDELF